jgi:hypothetical protein
MLTVISLCDRTGNMVQPWLEAGYYAVTVDLQEAINHHPRRWHVVADVTTLRTLPFDKAFDAAACFCFPPCTDLSVSGARWFRSKGLDALIEALRVVSACQKLAEGSGVPWMLENPVSTISKYWRPPDYTFHPCDFTGFELGDNYSKKTCLWTGNGFVMPDPFMRATDAPDDRIHKAAPGPERSNLRSATPAGFARAVFLANAPHLKSEKRRA